MSFHPTMPLDLYFKEPKTIEEKERARMFEPMTAEDGEEVARMVINAMQTDLSGEVKERYYCIHCDWYGFDPVKKTSEGYKTQIFTLCPKCDWVAYPESHIAEGRHTCYPILKKKYDKLHKVKKEPFRTPEGESFRENAGKLDNWIKHNRIDEYLEEE